MKTITRWTDGATISTGETWQDAINAAPRNAWGGANLTRARLTGVDLTGVDLTGAILTGAILTLHAIVHLVALMGLAVYLVRAHRRDAAQMAALVEALTSRHTAAQPVATVPPAPVSGVHAVPTGDADASDDDRRTVEIAHGMDVWASDTGERPSVEELTTVHVPVAMALSGGTRARLARLASGVTGQPRVADAPANVRRAKGGA